MKHLKLEIAHAKALSERIVISIISGSINN